MIPRDVLRAIVERDRIAMSRSFPATVAQQDRRDLLLELARLERVIAALHVEQRQALQEWETKHAKGYTRVVDGVTTS